MHATIDTASATIATMLAFYNEHAPAPRKSFKDRATAIKACEALQANIAAAAMTAAAMERAAATASAATAEEAPVAAPVVVVPDTVVVQQIPSGKSGKVRNSPAAPARTPEQEALRAARYPVATAQERTLQTAAGATVRIRPATTGDFAPEGTKVRASLAIKMVGDVPNNATITILAQGNPKGEGTKRAARFALYRDGMTVADYIAAGGRRKDVRVDIVAGNISVSA